MNILFPAVLHGKIMHSAILTAFVACIDSYAHHIIQIAFSLYGVECEIGADCADADLQRK